MKDPLVIGDDVTRLVLDPERVKTAVMLYLRDVHGVPFDRVEWVAQHPILVYLGEKRAAAQSQQ